MTTASVLVGDVRVGRMAGAALATGVLGGSATAVLTIVMAADGATPFAQGLAIAVPVLLAALIGRDLRAAAPADRWLAVAAAAGCALITAVQVVPLAGFRAGDWAELGMLAVAAAIYGSLFGLMAALVAIVVMVPVVLVLRDRIGRAPLRLLVTVIVTGGTAAFAYLVTADMGAPVVTGMAAALAGTGAALGTRR